MKKLNLLFTTVLFMLSACSSNQMIRIETEDLGSFELPKEMIKQETSEELLNYSDEKDGYYYGDVTIRKNVLPKEVSFDEYVIYINEYLKSLADTVFDETSYQDPVQTEIEIDGNKAVRTMIKGDDGYILEMIEIEIAKQEEVVVIEVLFDYQSKKYKGLSDTFVESYKYYNK